MAKQDLVVELFYGGTWNAVEAYTRDPVRITRVRSEGSEPTPFTATLTLKGFHNPKSPLSPLYGLAGQNTTISFQVDTENRFFGEVASWNPRRALKGDEWTEVETAGILRRLGQGADPLRSDMRRSIADTAPLLYYPAEDGTAATRIASGLASGKSLQVIGAPAFASVDVLAGSAPFAGFNPADGFVTADIVGASAGYLSIGISYRGAMATTPQSVSWLPVKVEFSGGTIASREIIAYAEYTAGAFTSLVEIGINSVVGTFGSGHNPWDGLGHTALFVMEQNGADVDYEVWVDGVLIDTATQAGQTLGTPVRLVGPRGTGFITSLPSGDANNTGAVWGMGHIVLHDSATMTATELHTFATAHTGEQAHERMVRLCAEEGIPLTVEGTESQLMGAQPRETLTALFAEIERTDDGVLFEPRDGYGLVYRCGRERYNRPVALVLDYAANEVAPPLDLILDDLSSRNDVTVNRRNGGRAQAVLEAGPLSVQSPPDGIGRYTTTIDVNTATDEVLPDHAWWHLSKGTVGGARYARVTVDLDAKPALVGDASAVDIGDVIALDNLPAEEATGRVLLMVLGYTETIGSHRRLITFDCIPASPYDVGVWGSDATGSRWGARTTFLAEDLTDVETSVDVNTGTDVWATTASHPAAFPFDVDIGGLTYSCTAITGTHPNLTLTIVRLSDDKTHSSGDQVWVTDTFRWGL